ncbi:hypothetical protein Lser_V15G15578 [Lactuca serriola]
MGKWNYRRRWTPKNYYRDQRIPSPPTYYDTEFKFRGAWKNEELPWEERFCLSVGIPWEKIVNAKNYMNCYDNVINWNDSAGEASFSEAKNRFWAKINEIPIDKSQPNLDPDMYNHDIDWNPEIDLELIKDLDRAYFNPDEPQKVETLDGIRSNNDGFVPGCIIGLNEMNKGSENPWERSKNDKINGWDCFNNSVNKNIDPWERGATQEDREIKDCGWGGGGVSGSWHNDMMTRGGGANKSWKRVDDNSKNSWGNNRNTQRHEHNAYVGTSQGTQRGNNRGNFGRGQYNGSGWDSKVGSLKREGSQQYTSTYKSARLQYDDYRARGNQYRR